MATADRDGGPQLGGGSRRERKRARTRSELVGAARALIAERGLAGLRVSDITERTDVALGSFYSHFETKDEIVEAVAADALAAVTDAILDYGDQLADPAEAMSIGLRQLVGLCRTDPKLARLLVQLDDAEAHFEQIIASRARRVMNRGVASGRFCAGPPELLLTLAIAGVLAVIRAVVDGRSGEDVETDCATALLCLVGVPLAEAEELARRPLPQTTGPGAGPNRTLGV